MSTRLKTYVVGGLILGAATVAAVMATSAGEEPKVAAEDAKANGRKRDIKVVERVIVRGDDARIDGLSDRVRKLEDQSEASPDDLDDETDVSDLEAEAQNEEAVRAAFAEKTAIKRQMLDSRMQTDALDREWDGKMGASLSNVFQGELMDNVTSQHLDCRATLCRLEASHPDPGRQEAYLVGVVPRIFKEVGTEIDGIWQVKDTDENGASTSRLYFFRKGQMQEIEASIASASSGVSDGHEDS